jgi:hypothetical protein
VREPSARAARPNARLAAVAAALALTGVFAAATDVEFCGHGYGLFLLRGNRDAPLVLKDDLLLGDGSRQIVGVSLAPLRRLLALAPASSALPRLELEWSEVTGNGMIRNLFADGSELITNFSRYVDESGDEPHGLFVGGALPEVAETLDQDESGMSYHDARGWKHVWCNVNESLFDLEGQREWPPGKWTYLGSRVLISDPGRVVVESTHSIPFESGPLRVSRYAYFRAGWPFFRLGLRFQNGGDVPVRVTYAYGDEPWVGHFGSSAGNVGVVPGKIVRVATPVDPKGRWAGIVDEESGVVAFLAWPQEHSPDFAYFSNDTGFEPEEVGQPLDSNSVFIAAEWRDMQIPPGEGRSVLLTIGMARAIAPGIPPELPAKALQ